jgi:hypothetical protein
VRKRALPSAGWRGQIGPPPRGVRRPRFRTIQARPKDLSALPRQDELSGELRGRQEGAMTVQVWVAITVAALDVSYAGNGS